MKLHTVAMSQWRKAKALNIPLYDITVKSGDKVFAPSWDLLLAYKFNKGNVERDDVYTKGFHTLMKDSYMSNKQHWVDFLSQEEIAIACYCKAGDFCHRHLLVDYFEKVCNNAGIEFEYKGEIV